MSSREFTTQTLSSEKKSIFFVHQEREKLKNKMEDFF